jgi:class 3 adenylate cyclase
LAKRGLYGELEQYRLDMPEQSNQRRLAAILVADVIGYSRMMGADEAGTLATLKERRSAIFEPTIKAHHGRIIKLMGDGVLVEFGSAVNAVVAALDLQRRMNDVNTSASAERKMSFCIGINLGDVIGDGSDIYGDGVNVAARLEALAEVDGICISGQVHDEVTRKLDCYDRNQQDIFAVQDDVVRSIVGTLVGRLNAAGAEQFLRKPPASLMAYDYVLRGIALPVRDTPPRRRHGVCMKSH